jgi:hypothetical protein
MVGAGLISINGVPATLNQLQQGGSFADPHDTYWSFFLSGL